jgi:uncharacterized repeat protein (TIGR02543 family)
MYTTKHCITGSQRCLALLLVLALLCSTTVLAADSEPEDADSTLSASLNTTATFSTTGGYEVLEIESSLTQTAEKTEVAPCDIIFVLDQSKWLNGTNGVERKEILNAMEDVLETLETPATGEHRVAIAGYGRLNMNQQYDTYSAAQYPGIRHTGSTISLNTGYYTRSIFHSRDDWTDVDDATSTALPALSADYAASMTYDSAFMSVEDAEKMLDPDTSLAWYAGTSRLDAGLSLAQQLARIANSHDTGNNRPLIVCIVGSSLPMLGTDDGVVLRDDAVTAAAERLKSLGATVFAFGDYHNAGRDLDTDTEANFTAVMTAMCGSADTAEEDKIDYYFSKSKSGSNAEALSEMVTSITMAAAQAAALDVTVTVDNVTDVRQNRSQDWKTWLRNILAATPEAEAIVTYHAYTVSKDGDTTSFTWSPFAERTVPLRNLVQEDGTLQYETQLVPMRAEVTQSNTWAADQGTKVVITISTPVSVVHRWAGDADNYAPADVDDPGTEYVAYGAYVIPQDLSSDDIHYRFEGWYLDPDCRSMVVGAIAPIQDMTLYGKWTRFVLVNYYASAPYQTADAVLWVEPDTLLTEYILNQDGYRFGGWYTDAEMTQPYDWTQPVTEDMSLYAKWTPNTYTVRFQANTANTTGMTGQSLTYGTAEALAPNSFTRAGYTFIGWNTQADGSGISYADQATVKNLTATYGGVVTLYAQWQKNS